MSAPLARRVTHSTSIDQSLVDLNVVLLRGPGTRISLTLAGDLRSLGSVIATECVCLSTSIAQPWADTHGRHLQCWQEEAM